MPHNQSANSTEIALKNTNNSHLLINSDAEELKYDSGQQLGGKLDENLPAISANVATDLADNPTFSSQGLLTTNWENPIPVTAEPAPLPYPVDALPSIIRDAVLEIAFSTQAPLAIVANSALTMLSTAVQGHVNVCRPGGLSGPTSLYFLTLGYSGERKSTVDLIFGNVLSRFQENARSIAKPILAEYNAGIDIWTAQTEAIKTKTKQAMSKPRPDMRLITELQASLAELYKNKPKHPMIPNMLLMDITYEKLLQLLANEYPSCLIATAEGALILASRSMSKENRQMMLAALNALWSGERIQIMRKTVESSEVSAARLSLSLGIQPQVFDNFCVSNPLARDIGFFSRCLFANPISTQGSRLFKEAPATGRAMERYNHWILKILNTPLPIEQGKLTPNSIHFSNQAKDRWISFHNKIEIELGKNGKFSSLRDFASKAAENAARMATVFQAAYDFPISEINFDSMDMACAIIEWHLNEALIYFGVVAERQIEISRNSKHLADYIIKTSQREGKNIFKRSIIQQYGPSGARRREKFDPALNLLLERGWIKLNNDDRTIELNPLLASIPE